MNKLFDDIALSNSVNLSVEDIQDSGVVHDNLLSDIENINKMIISSESSLCDLNIATEEIMLLTSESVELKKVSELLIHNIHVNLGYQDGVDLSNEVLKENIIKVSKAIKAAIVKFFKKAINYIKKIFGFVNKVNNATNIKIDEMIAKYKETGDALAGGSDQYHNVVSVAKWIIPIPFNNVLGIKFDPIRRVLVYAQSQQLQMYQVVKNSSDIIDNSYTLKNIKKWITGTNSLDVMKKSLFDELTIFDEKTIISEINKVCGVDNKYLKDEFRIYAAGDNTKYCLVGTQSDFITLAVSYVENDITKFTTMKIDTTEVTNDNWANDDTSDITSEHIIKTLTEFKEVISKYDYLKTRASASVDKLDDMLSKMDDETLALEGNTLRAWTILMLVIIGIVNSDSKGIHKLVSKL